MTALMQRVLRSPVLAFVGLAIAWEIAVHAFAPSPRYLPALSAIAQDAWSVWPQLVRGFGRTLLETVLGFAMGAVFGCLCGTVFTYSRWMERSVFPLFVVSQTVPVVGEWFGETVGLGVMLMEAMNGDLVVRLWVVMFACGLMGALLYGLLTFVERRLVWWRSES